MSSLGASELDGGRLQPRGILTALSHYVTVPSIFAHLKHSHPKTIPDETMFKKRRLTNPWASGSNADPNPCELVQRLPSSRLFDR